MKVLKVFCFGFGQVAKNFIKKLNNEKTSFQLTTTSREETKNKIFEGKNYKSFYFDGKNFDNNLTSIFRRSRSYLSFNSSN